MTRLIVNADDLGYGEGVNHGILEAHEGGILTSTSLMVDGDAAAHGVELAGRAPRLGIGLHAVVDGVEPARCEEELERQLERFEELVGRRPTHVDSHHHLHRERALLPIFERFASRHALPLRDRDSRHEGGFYGGTSIEVAALLRLLDRLDGDAELGCHPGYAAGLRSRYTVEREVELRTLTDPQVRARVEELEIELVRWDEL